MLKYLVVSLLFSTALYSKTTSNINGNIITVDTEIGSVEDVSLKALIKKVEKTLAGLPVVYSLERTLVKDVDVEGDLVESKDISYYVMTNITNHEYMHMTLNYKYTTCAKDTAADSCIRTLEVKPHTKLTFITNHHAVSHTGFNLNYIDSKITVSCTAAECNVNNSFTLADMKLISWVRRAAKIMGAPEIPSVQTILKTSQRTMRDFNLELKKSLQ